MRRRWPLVAIALIGLGLAAAPLAFQMFTRAPRGGDMIKGFKPYMTHGTIQGFRNDLATIGAARSQVVTLQQRHDLRNDSAVSQFTQAWPGIDADMGSMLTTMQDNIGHYRGVAALPPFVLFPWFFVLPGLIVAGVALWTLRSRNRGLVRRGPRIALAALGLAIIAAPAVFQMFTRAPGGAQMIDEFKPFMTTAKVTHIQGYFLTIGDAEGDLRLRVLPALAAAHDHADTSAIRTLSAQWPTISATMAPMIGAMADNVPNFDAVAALPPFWLFPWFFVAPGALVAALALLPDSRGRSTQMTLATPVEVGSA